MATPTTKELRCYQWDRWAVYALGDPGPTIHCDDYRALCVFELGARWHVDGPAELERAAKASEKYRYRSAKKVST